MPSPLAGNWTLRQLLNNTYQNMRNRFDNKERDVIKKITVRKIAVYQRDPENPVAPGQDRTKYVITSYSYPQYPPYRPRSKTTRQLKYRHQYDVTIQLDRLSIDMPVKLRTGADRMWRMESRVRVQGQGRHRRVLESDNIKLGLNGDFFFRLSWIYKEEGILFGRNHAGWFPRITNPDGIVFLDKHMIATVEKLMNMGILGEGV